jgi:Na+-transporting NADH:ubiquinone oxidoreductase subunit C
MFVLALCVAVALILASLFTLLKPIHDLNEAVYNKKSVLRSVEAILPQPVNSFSNAEIEAFFAENVEQFIIDAEGNLLEDLDIKAEQINMEQEEKKPSGNRIYPLFIYTHNDGSQYFILAMRGNGLWDKIWAYLALKDDRQTVQGVAFEHAAETPGLGAEIKENRRWVSQFSGKPIYNEDGEFTSVVIRKGGARQPHEVDGITGATVTTDGVNEMLYRGINVYRPFLASLN